MNISVNLTIVIVCTVLGLLWERRQRRSAEDVWNSLGESTNEQKDQVESRRTEARPTERKGMRRYIPLCCACTAGGIGSAAGSAHSTVLILFGIGFCFGFLLRQRMVENDRVRALRELDFFVPLMMERIVMAAHAGFDVLSAVRAVVQHEERQAGMVEERLNPVCALLTEVMARSDRGMSFERALQQVASDAGSHSIRHAFLHLAMAHKEGGELIAPLRELSDATLLHYQESIEEEIAKLPAKATMPLILTFTGLIVLFLTPPLLSVMDITTKAQLPAAHGTRGGK